MKSKVNKKHAFFSLLAGVLISIALLTSVQFPAWEGTKPLATASAYPTHRFALLLDFFRVALDGEYGFVSGCIAILFAIACYMTIKKTKEMSLHSNIWLLVLSLIFGVMNVFGLCMYWLDRLPMFYSKSWLLLSGMMLLGWGALFWICARWVWFAFDKYALCLPKTSLSESKVRTKLQLLSRWAETHLFLFAFLILFLCWLPWVICYYPASMDNDVFWMLKSYYEAPSNHHPYFATCVLAWFYEIGKHVGNENLGIFLYVMVRNLILIWIYANCVELLKKVGFKPVVYYLALAFYAVTPVWGAYAKHAFKDTYGAGLFCLYILSLVLVIQAAKKSDYTHRYYILHGIVALVTALFRNNCIYVIVPTTILLTLLLIKRKKQWLHLGFIWLCVIGYFCFNTYIFQVVGVEPGEKREALSLLYQQTARTVKYHSDDLSETEVENLKKMFRYEHLADAYDPIVSDPVKCEWCLIPEKEREEGSDAIYYKTWLAMGYAHPVCYMEAAIAQSYGYYAFTPRLPEQSGNWNSGMTIFDWIGCSDDYAGDYDFHYVDTFAKGRENLQAWAKVWDKIPLLSLTDVCALYTWLLVLMGAYLLKNKKLAEAIPIFAALLMALTCVASPVNDCFRYYAPVAASVPAILVLFGNKSLKVEKREKKR